MQKREEQYAAGNYRDTHATAQAKDVAEIGRLNHTRDLLLMSDADAERIREREKKARKEQLRKALRAKRKAELRAVRTSE
jgi:hypothetical protein